MKKIKYKLSLYMVLSTVIIFVLVFLGLHFYQERYIFAKAEEALRDEAIYFLGEDAYDERIDEDRYFYVDYIFIDDFSNSFGMGDGVLRGERIIKDKFYTGELEANHIERISEDSLDYCVLLLSITDANILNEFYHDNISELGELNVILYTDISSSSNIVKSLNIIFFIILLFAVLIQGALGAYLGMSIENTQKKLKHFFENASHELKTPLMSIRGYSQGLKSGMFEDEAAAIDVILKQSDNMQTLIDEILNISKLDSGEYKFKNEDVDIIDIVEESLDNYMHLARENSIEIDFQTELKEAITKGDALQIYKAINTVINNAFKFASTKVGIKLCLEKPYIVLDIYNDGGKIKEENIAHIFDRFYSASNNSTGIGLAMARDILLQSRGKISVKNLSNGVVFTLCFRKK